MPLLPRLAAAAAATSLVAALGTVGPVAPGASAAPAPASMAPTLLAGDVVSGLSRLEASEPTRPTPATTVLTLGVSVADPDPGAIAAFDRSVNTPGSADYRQFPTPAQFDARFGPTGATVASVTSWLRSGGLHVFSHDATPGYLTATGTVGQIGTLMKTSFLTFSRSGLIANATGPTVPAAVLGVAGLNTGTHPRLDPPLRDTSPAATSTGLLTPPDLWDIYRQPADDEGQGQGLALFGYGTTVNDLTYGVTGTTPTGTDPQPGDATVLSDLRAFEAEYSLPQIPYYLTYFSSAPGETLADDGGYDEWTLDAQAADGMAPDAAKLVDYFATTGSDPDVIGAYDSWVNDPNGPLQGSSSFGGCEEIPGDQQYYTLTSQATYLGNPNQDLYEQVFAQAVGEGRTLFAASGDTDGCPVIPVAVNGATPVYSQIQDYPGVSPNVVGVGGSVLYFTPHSSTAAATRVEEYPWPYSGGGQSHFVAAGAYQANAVQPVSTVGTAAGAGAPVDAFFNATDAHGDVYPTPQRARLVPDVAALSGDITGNGYTICEGNQGTTGTTCNSFGAGTSLSSPLWLGMWARVQAAAPADAGTYPGLGFADDTIYRLAQQPGEYFDNYYDLGDVGETPPSVANNNGGGGTTSPAEGGYDTQTGWGVLNVTSFTVNATGNTSTTPTDPAGGTPTTGPPVATPEVPLAVGLPLAFGAVGWVAFRRRQRSRRRSTPAV